MSDRTDAVLVDRSDSNAGGSGRFRSRLGALVYWFKKSRDAWKQKYMDLKAEVHRMKVRIRDVAKSRDRWREQAEVSETRVAQLQAELERLQAYVSEPPQDPIKTRPTPRRPRAANRLQAA